tara:strand:+ start:266 stop:427 length:162 start_codon:yes stop_codon:yes gene_type:complete
LIRVGDTKRTTVNFNQGQVIKFSEVTGDLNPLHLDDQYAKKTIFKKNNSWIAI